MYIVQFYDRYKWPNSIQDELQKFAPMRQSVTFKNRWSKNHPLSNIILCNVMKQVCHYENFYKKRPKIMLFSSTIMLEFFLTFVGIWIKHAYFWKKTNSIFGRSLAKIIIVCLFMHKKLFCRHFCLRPYFKCRTTSSIKGHRGEKGKASGAYEGVKCWRGKKGLTTTILKY